MKEVESDRLYLGMEFDLMSALFSIQENDMEAARIKIRGVISSLKIAYPRLKLPRVSSEIQWVPAGGERESK